MKTHTTIALPAFAMLALVLAPAAPAVELVTNGGFEVGTGADADAWNELEIAAGSQGATATTDRVNASANTGDYAMFLELAGAPDYGPVAEIQQQTAVGTVAAGNAYNFSFQSMGVAGPGTVAFYEVLWMDGDGSDGGGPKGSASGGLQNYALGGTYTLNQLNDLIAPTGADSVLIQIRLVTGAFDGASGSAYIDDVSFSQVPEPASLALMGLGGLAMIARRRHKA